MKRFLKALLIFIIGLPVLAAFGYWYLQQQIADAGISDLQLDVSRLTVRSASLASLRFQLQQNGARHQVELQNVELKWQWPAAFKPALQQISFGPADITLDQPAGSSTTADSPLTLPATWHLPDWLPKHIQLTDTRLRLPCPAGQCQLMVNGYLKYDDNPPLAASTETRSDTPGVPVSGQPEADNSAYWQSRLTLSPQFGSVGSLNDTSAASANIIVDARYQPAPEPALQLTLQQENQLGVSIRQQLNPASGQAVTEIVLALSPPSSANQTVLQKWGVNLPASWLTQFQQPVQLYSKLHWQVPANGDLSSLFSSHDIEAMLIARAPDPFYLPALGLIQGELNGELRLKNQRVERWQFSAAGRLSELTMATTLSEYGLVLSPLQFTVSANATEPLNLATLPLQLRLSSDGDSRFTLDSELTVDLSGSPSFRLGNADLNARIARLELANKAATVTSLALKTRLSGHWQADSWQFQLSDSSALSGGFSSDTLSGRDFTIFLKNSQLSGDETGLTAFNSKLDLSVNTLSAATLVNQSWQWQGLLSGNTTQVTIENGQLSNDAGISLAHQLNFQPAASKLAMEWQLAEVFLLAGNPLPKTINGWPELLTLNRGKLSASGKVRLDDNQLTSNSQLQLGELGGIYDRSLFAGLTASIDIAVDNDHLALQTKNLRLNRLNHGFEMGPLQLTGSARVPLDRPEQLTISLQQAELQLMQGHITANNQQLDFSQRTNQLLLQLQQIDLASLLQQHPSSDFTGNGKLSGSVPIVISNNGISVNNGYIAAEAPGGRLQYQSQSASAMAKSNRNMKLVFDALENFHYTVLSSDVSYDTSGKLVLGLKLQGSNPNLQQGRAINLNVNLEEDVPALITSLQLTSKLNDVITQRVKQHLKQQQAASAANGEKP